MQFGQLKRREFITLLGGAATAWPFNAWAQRPAMTRVGVVTIQPRTAPPWAALDQRLRELGYIEGQNLIVDFLNPEHQAGGNTEAVQVLLRQKADIIVAIYESTLKAALAATTTVPIVMVAIEYDPLALGYVKSLSRPGGNATGVYLQQIELARKRLQLLTDALPGVQTATMFWDSGSEDQWKTTSSAAAAFGLRLAGVELREQPYDYESALARAPPDHRSALIVSVSSQFYRDRQRLVDFALRHKIASMFGLREWVEAGGLLSYGASFPAIFRRVAEYVDRIAKGVKAADLPIEQPTKFELVLNLKTAKAIGITIAPAILVRADDVIE
jgi:putative tryptophan/tyrosine transport system substrate-binding protein